MRDSIKLIAAFGFLAVTAEYAGLLDDQFTTNQTQGITLASTAGVAQPMTTGTGVPHAVAREVDHAMTSAAIANALEPAGRETRAEPLKRTLERLAERHGIEVSGARLLHGEAPAGRSGALEARLAALLAGYNHILVRGRDGAVSRIVIVSAKDHYASPPGGTLAAMHAERRQGVQVASLEHVSLAEQVTMVEPASIVEQVAKIEPKPVTRRFVVYFGFDSARVSSQGKKTIGEALDFVRAHRSARVSVAGHADRAGTDEYNQKLSERRASAVAATLGASAGADKTITVRALGESDAAVPTADGVAEPRNRRVEIVIRA